MSQWSPLYNYYTLIKKCREKRMSHCWWQSCGFYLRVCRTWRTLGILATSEDMEPYHTLQVWSNPVMQVVLLWGPQSDTGECSVHIGSWSLASTNCDLLKWLERRCLVSETSVSSDEELRVVFPRLTRAGDHAALRRSLCKWPRGGGGPRIFCWFYQLDSQAGGSAVLCGSGSFETHSAITWGVSRASCSL
jgi:hypothetical protein